MAHGLPDYYRGVDIAYQALSELISRPKYGGAIGSRGSTVVTASAVTDLVSVAGKGMLYGGYLFMDYTSTQFGSFVQLEADGATICKCDFTSLNKYVIDDPCAFPLTLYRYDNAAFIYSVGIGYGITFETSLKLQYDEQHGTTPDVNYNLIYALV